MDASKRSWLGSPTLVIYIEPMHTIVHVLIGNSQRMGCVPTHMYELWTSSTFLHPQTSL